MLRYVMRQFIYIYVFFLQHHESHMYNEKTRASVKIITYVHPFEYV